MAKKGLGTGLGALFGDSAIDTAPNDFEYIPISKIEPRADQPRTVFEQEKIDELSDSIREHGVLQPLTVRRMDGGFYQIIAGERRWRAARASGLKDVPARVIVADDKKAAQLAMVENLQREDLNPIEEALGYRELVREFGMTQEEVAKRMSKSRPVIANALRLLTLPESLIERVSKGELHAGSARALLSLRDEDEIIAAAEIVIAKGLSVREVEQLVKKLGTEKPERKPEKARGISVNYVEEAGRELTAALGRRVTISQGRNKGKIEIEYYGQDDFDTLFSSLAGKAKAPQN